jgi:hypothetical protein
MTYVSRESVDLGRLSMLRPAFSHASHDKDTFVFRQESVLRPMKEADFILSFILTHWLTI